MDTNLHVYVLDELEKRRGKWPAIAKETGVPYDTITKIAQKQIIDPKVSRLQRLADYFRQQAALADSSKEVWHGQM